MTGGQAIPVVHRCLDGGTPCRRRGGRHSSVFRTSSRPVVVPHVNVIRWITMHDVIQLYHAPMEQTLRCASVMRKLLDVVKGFLQMLREADIGMCSGWIREARTKRFDHGIMIPNGCSNMLRMCSLVMPVDVWNTTATAIVVPNGSRRRLI